MNGEGCDIVSNRAMLRCANMHSFIAAANLKGSMTFRGRNIRTPKYPDHI